MRESRELVTRPRPPPFAGEAGFVDVDNDNLRIIALRKRELEARVVRDRLELGEKAALADLGQRMQHEKGDDDQRDQPSRRSDELRGEAAGSEMHVV